MYIEFGNEIIDSKDMKEKIEKNTEFRVIKDMSKGSKREDILAFNLSITIDTLNNKMLEESNVNVLTEDKLFEEYLNSAEKIATSIKIYTPAKAIVDIKAYKWEPSDRDIKLVIAIAHEEIRKFKLRDIMNRLLTQVE